MIKRNIFLTLIFSALIATQAFSQGIKISALPSGGTPTGAEILPADQTGTTKKFTFDNILDGIRKNVYSTSGTDTYTISVGWVTSYTNLVIPINFTNANTTAATINFNSLGVKNIVNPDGTAVTAGQLTKICWLSYDGTNFQLIGGSTKLFDDTHAGSVRASGGGTVNFLRADGAWTTPASPPQFTDMIPGIVPQSGGGTVNYLRADGSWSTPPSGGSSTSGSFPLRGNGTGGFTNLFWPSNGQIVRVTAGPDFDNSGISSDGTTATFGAVPNFPSQTANKFFASPNGSSGVPSFRSPVIADISNLGTSVGTALGTNVGSAGSVVINGGALGTPSSGTATNLTGLPISTGVGGLGTNVAAALGVNVGSAGAFVVSDNGNGTAAGQVLTTNASGNPTFQNPGGGGLTNISVSGSTTLTSANFGQMIFVSGGGYTINLPTAVGNNGVIYFQFVNGVSSLITLDGNASETIDGQLTQLFWAKESCVIVSDGSNWNFNYVKRISMYAGLWANTDQTGIATATPTKLATNTLLYDNYGSVANTSTQKLTCARSGHYGLKGYINFLNGGTSSTSQFFIYLNGTLWKTAFTSNSTASYYSTARLDIEVDLTTGDYLEVYGQHNTGSSNGVMKAGSSFYIRELF